MAKSLDIMAKVAGKDLKQMQDDNIARMRDGATQAKLRLLEQRGVAGATDAYQKSLVSLGAAPKVAKDLLKDLVQTGAPMTDATKAFAATNKEAYAALVQQANAIKQGKVEEAEALGKKATAASIAYANSEQGLTLATLGQLSPIAKQQADNLEQVGPLIDQIKERAKQIGEPLNDTASYVRTFNDIIKQTADITGAQTSGGVKGQELSRELNNIQADIGRSASKINESIGKFLDSNTALISGISGVADQLRGILQVAGSSAGSSPNLASPNSSNVLTSRNIEDPELARIAQGIESGAVQGAAREAAIQKLVDLGVMDSTGKIISKVRTRSLGGGFERGDILKVGEQGPETMIAGMDGAIIPNMKGMLNRLPKMAEDLQDTLTNSIDPTAIQAKITDKFDPNINDGGKAYRPGEREYAEQAAAEGNKRSLAKFNADFDRAMADTSSSIASNFSPDITEVMSNRSDTSSNTNFPDLSGIFKNMPDMFSSMFSSVMPDMTKTMQQGMEGMPNMKNMVAKMPDSIKQLQKEITTMGASANNAAKPPALLPEIKGASSSDIGTLIKHAELTNELLSQLLGVNTTQVRVGEKQLRTVRSAGNLMNGIGRA